MGQLKARQLRLAELNDHFRRTGYGGDRFITRGVHDLGPAFVAKAIGVVGAFDRFNEENDPYGEHDFGVVFVDGERIYFKIDYYDRDRDGRSPDPADTVVTTRIMTIMLAEDY
jgi:Protein of unknown function (DUF3768)